jgi:hypothetical protein
MRVAKVHREAAQCVGWLVLFDVSVERAGGCGADPVRQRPQTGDDVSEAGQL